jgi:hypothetical protein
MVRKTQAAVVHGRDQRAQAASSAAQQRRHRKRKGHRETHIAHVEHGRVDDHARVLQQRVQVAAVIGTGSSRWKGLDVSSTNSRKPTDTRPSTPSMRATIGSGRRAQQATASIHSRQHQAHSSSEPSWPPQTAAMR